MVNDRLPILRAAIAGSGLPLGYEVASLARHRGWDVLQEKRPPEDNITSSQIDLLAYKTISGRRVELRIACVSQPGLSHAFYMQERSFVPAAWDVKFAPVISDLELRNRLPSQLQGMRLFSCPKEAFTYASFDEAGVQSSTGRLHSAHENVVLSLEDGIFPGLLHDQRCRLFLFLVVIRGELYEVSYTSPSAPPEVVETHYVQVLSERRPRTDDAQRAISNPNNHPVLLSNALHWFGPFVRVEFVASHALEGLLVEIETTLASVSEDDLAPFGRPWRSSSAPKTDGTPPNLEPIEIVDEEHYIRREH